MWATLLGNRWKYSSGNTTPPGPYPAGSRFGSHRVP